MSRIGKLPIEIPTGVKVILDEALIKVEGPKGTLSRPLMDGVTIQVVDNKQIIVTRVDDSLKSRSFHGLTRTLVNNMVVGVTKGFETILDITGVGYRAEVKGDSLTLSLGYSHPINFPLPTGISVEVEKMTKVFVRGSDKELVGQTAAKIRSFRLPEPYKGKGIKYSDEKILRKAGKTGKK
ncbi:MAG: 50S ribosomal protein L6 [Geobacteraceae bacterium]|nr:50S ribosomal protein L6 [Geobacteraceae bacterium]